jgi:hypothetical protein
MDSPRIFNLEIQESFPEMLKYCISNITLSKHLHRHTFHDRVTRSALTPFLSHCTGFYERIELIRNPQWLIAGPPPRWAARCVPCVRRSTPPCPRCQQRACLACALEAFADRL